MWQSHANGDTDGHSYGNSNTNGDSCRISNGYGHSHGDCNCDGHSHSHGDCNCDCDRTAAAYTDATASADTASSPVGILSGD